MTLNICFQSSPSACRSLHVDFKCQRNKPAVLRATYSEESYICCSSATFMSVLLLNK